MKDTTPIDNLAYELYKSLRLERLIPVIAAIGGVIIPIDNWLESHTTPRGRRIMTCLLIVIFLLLCLEGGRQI